MILVCDFHSDKWKWVVRLQILLINWTSNAKMCNFYTCLRNYIHQRQIRNRLSIYVLSYHIESCTISTMRKTIASLGRKVEAPFIAENAFPNGALKFHSILHPQNCLQSGCDNKCATGNSRLKLRTLSTSNWFRILFENTMLHYASLYGSRQWQHYLLLA